MHFSMAGLALSQVCERGSRRSLCFDNVRYVMLEVLPCRLCLSRAAVRTSIMSRGTAPACVLGLQDADIRKAFKRTLQKQGLKMKLGTKVNKAENTGSGVKLWVEPAKGGKEEVLEADVVLVAAGTSSTLCKLVHPAGNMCPCWAFAGGICTGSASAL